MVSIFTSGLAPLFDEFVLYKKATRRWSNSSQFNLHRFDQYCSENFPNETVLTQAMLKWCDERPSENNNSCSYRISIIREFVRFARKMKWTDLELPSVPSYKPSTYIPHYFSEAEKQAFFAECDNYILQHERLGSRTRIFVIPVIFRLIFSTGMRTNEARRLKCSDVDFVKGIININDSKGNDKHRVALHESMLQLLWQYHNTMSQIMPKRTMFFPKDKDQDSPLNESALDSVFRNTWKKIKATQPAILYDFRHNYAIENISKWKDVGYQITDNLIRLGHSMGHVKVSSTMRYFSLTPCFSDKIKDLSEDKFNDLFRQMYEEKD